MLGINLYIDPTKELDLLEELIEASKEERVYSTVYLVKGQPRKGFVVTQNPKDRKEAERICRLRELGEKVDELVAIKVIIR